MQVPALITTIVVVGLHVIYIARAILRPHRDATSRIAWVLAIIGAPVIGITGYILLGETNVGRGRKARARAAISRLPKLCENQPLRLDACKRLLPERHASLFALCGSINGFAPVSGSQAVLMEDSNAAIDAIVADIDAAGESVHLSFYIWLADNNGLKVASALERASLRGVTCRVMADGLGSRGLIASPHWQAMKSAGVQLQTTLKIGNPLLRALKGRIDLRNHRKIVVIDNGITYCGSQNCADPEFLVKAKFAPWVDLMVRFTGAIVRQNQYLFASDWMAEGGDDLTACLEGAAPAAEAGFAALVIGTGPTLPYAAMSEVFTSMIYAAEREIVITTPYFVPDDAIQSALCASARRGIHTTLIVPERNDSRIVAAASRSFYRELLEAGIEIHEFSGGLLHSKSMIVDSALGLIGSANLDRRSFELNYENNILFYDAGLAMALRARQDDYLARSGPVSLDAVLRWPILRRFWNNSVAMFGPVL